MFRPIIYGDPERLHVSPTAIVNNALFNLSSGELTVEDYAFFGHNVSVLTGTHDWTTFGAERLRLRSHPLSAPETVAFSR